MLVCALVTVALSALLWFALAPRGGGAGDGGPSVLVSPPDGGGDDASPGGGGAAGDDDPAWWPEFERALGEYQRRPEREPA